MTGNVRIGICSWTDRTLLKSGFYPASANTPASRLAHYASEFDTVEVDSSFYAIPSVANACRWIAGTPKNFSFGVKSFSLFTFHRTSVSSLPSWLASEMGNPREGYVKRGNLTHDQRMHLFDDFMKPVRILHSAGRLAYLLFQFPPGWRFRPEWLTYFRRIREVSGPLPLAVEIRNSSWFEEECRGKFLSVLMDQNIAYAAVDEPDLGWTAPREWPVTAEWGTLARFHGRNREGWRNPRASVRERFDYEYDALELAPWALEAVRIAGEMGDSKKIFLMYNNCVGDKAVRGARMMRGMLGLDAPVARAGQRLLFDSP
ncbi:MAG: DUF72 domain-containing protein [Synergistaceae bacterium]|nr:DUF72 domain-containing protein [Synergistaceae bacterium]